MRNLIRRLRTRSRRAAPFCFCALLFAASSALAQDPVVTAADPDMAEQETYGLVVKVSGSNFGTDSEVDFLVTGSETDSGGITVRNVKRKNPKTLEVTIDVAPDAQFQKKFDIRVRSNGRTGKGTELFRVIEKATGNGDTTPPGDVIDLAVQETDLGSAVLTWRAPADDGYDATSGTTAGYQIRLRTDGQFTLGNWDSDLRSLRHGLIPAYVPHWPALGELATDRSLGLSPGTSYWAAVRAYDEAQNLSGISQVFFTSPEAPATNWSEEEIGRPCPSESTSWLFPIDLAIDLAGEPALLYSERCESNGQSMWLHLARRVGGQWLIERLPLASYDPRFEDLAFDPVTGEPTVAHAIGTGKLYLYRKSGSGWSSEVVERSQAGSLSLAYAEGQPTVAYKRGPSIRVARGDGNRWEKSEFALPSSQNTGFGTLHLVFDGAGHPAIAYGMDRDGNASAEVVQFAIWDGGAWQLERVAETAPGGTLGSVSLAWDSSRQDFSLAYAGGDQIHSCDRTGPGSWACQTLPIDLDRYPVLWTSALVYGDAGESYLFYAVDTSFLMSVARAPGEAGWSAPEFVASDTFYYRACWDGSGQRPVLGTLSGGSEPDLPAELRFLWRQP